MNLSRSSSAHLQMSKPLATQPSSLRRASFLALVAGLSLWLSPAPQARSGGFDTACRSNLKNLATGLEMYASDNQGEYPASLASLTPNYLRTIPNCPAARYDTYSGSYTRTSKPAAFVVYCSGHHHKATRRSPNSPYYDSEQGIGDTFPQAASLSSCEQTLTQAGEQLKQRKGKLPEKSGTHCPSSGREYLLEADGKNFTLCCSGAAHLGENVVPFNPKYNSQSGLSSEHLPALVVPLSSSQPTVQHLFDLRWLAVVLPGLMLLAAVSLNRPERMKGP